MPPEGDISTPKSLSGGSIYFDYQATTMTDVRVIEAMMPWFGPGFGNPHSLHAWGLEAAQAVETARGDVAKLIGAEPREIVFTSGATESNNLAIKGAARFLAAHGSARRKIVTVATEHKCVLESCHDLEREGFEVDILPVGSDGLVDLQRIADALDDETALISVMAANNEIGVLQDISAIGALARARGVLFHCDAAQAFGKIPLDVRSSSIDLLSISGHKIYGPKGVGALFVRYRPRVRLSPLFSGGGQERGLRSGTLPTPLIVGLGTASTIASVEMEAETVRLEGLRGQFLQLLSDKIDGILMNGALSPRLPGNLNLSFNKVVATDLVSMLPQFALSTGSACSATDIEPSYVIRALGVPAGQVAGAIRIGFGRQTTDTEITLLAAHLVYAIGILRMR